MARFIALLVCVLALAARDISAAAFEIELGVAPNPVGSGARALGLGNAFIAVADDATAANWNPAGLAQLWRPELSLAVEHIGYSTDVNPGGPISWGSDHTPWCTELNYLSLVTPIPGPKRNVVVSLNYLRLYSFNRDVDLAGAVDYGPDLDGFGFHADVLEHAEQTGSLAVLAPAIGIDVTDRLSLGLTFNIWDDAVTHSSHFKTTRHSRGAYQNTLDFGFGPMVLVSDHFDDVYTQRYEVDHGYSVTLGGMYRFCEAWTAGVVVKPPASLHMQHEQTSTLETVHLDPNTGAETGVDAGTVVTRNRVKLHLPWIAGAGVAWRPNDHWTVSGDVTWTQWSEYSLHGPQGEQNPLNGKDFNGNHTADTVTCRLGAEYVLICHKWLVPLRCGIGYDPAPAIGEPDDFYTANVGVGFQRGNVMIDLGEEVRWGNNVNRSVLADTGANEDVIRNRFLASIIYYF